MVLRYVKLYKYKQIALFFKWCIAVQQREIDLGVDCVAHCSLYFLLSSKVRKSRNKKKTELFYIMLLN